MSLGSYLSSFGHVVDATRRPFDTWALDVFYRGFFADPLLADFYGDSGYANFGYWDATTKNATEACDRLVDRLVELLGDEPGDRRVLDVACGQGGTTQRLSTHFGATNLTAINVSQPQLTAAAERVPDASFHNMDAASMDFPDRSFDVLVCVEAAFHFDTRRSFLEEALRVLKPGGAIVLSDLLMVRGAPTIPSANFLPDRAAYASQLHNIGFEAVHIEPAMAQTLDGFRLNFSDHITAHRQSHGWYTSTRDLYFTNVTLAITIKDALLAVAKKPA